MCGRCMAVSPSITAADGKTAWKWLVRMGWSHYLPTKSSQGHALCARCSGTPWSIDLAAEMAKKDRKGK